MSRYWLAKHVFLCECGDQVILLDLRKDRYMALNAAHARQLAGLVQGWPFQRDELPAESATTARESSAGALAEKMVERGLLTLQQASGAQRSARVIAPARSTLVQPLSLLGEDDWGAGLPVRAHHLPALAASAAVAAAKLRWRALERVVGDVSQRRARQSVVAAVLDLERARELVAIYRRLRPYVFTAHNKCLLDSLALLNFLAYYRLFPHWVFGVRTAPFAAHCWIQLDDTVFNDSVDHVGFYTPIMVA